MARKLVELWDPALEVEALEEAEVLGNAHERMRQRALLCVAVALFKRRLGGNVADLVLARDKKTARQCAGAFLNVVVACGGGHWQEGVWAEYCGMALEDLELRALAATMKWGPWIDRVVLELEAELKWLSAWVLRHNTKSLPARTLFRRTDQCRDRLIAVRAEVIKVG